MCVPSPIFKVKILGNTDNIILVFFKFIFCYINLVFYVFFIFFRRKKELNVLFASFLFFKTKKMVFKNCYQIGY